VTICDETAYCVYLAERVLSVVPLLEKEIPGVRGGGDIEHIHRMRVASRRIRVALGLLDGCLGVRELRRMRRSVRGVTRALGAARDADVQIAFLTSYAAQLPAGGSSDPIADRPADGRESVVGSVNGSAILSFPPPGSVSRTGIRCLLLRLVQEREALQPGVIRALDHLERSAALTRITERLRHRMERWRREAGSMACARTILSVARRTVALRIDELVALAPALSDPGRRTEHHAMRIAAKRLRYTIEAFAPLFEDGLRTELKAVKDLQEVLGELHDCDVWIDRLPRFLEEERARALAYFGNEGLYPRIEPGVIALYEDRRTERVRIHGKALSAWRWLERGRFPERLLERFPLPEKRTEA